MTVTKAVVRGILIAVSVSTSTSRAGSILVLGVTPSYSDAPLIAASPTVSFDAPFTPTPSLRLGLTSNSSPLVFQPTQPVPGSTPIPRGSHRRRACPQTRRPSRVPRPIRVRSTLLSTWVRDLTRTRVI